MSDNCGEQTVAIYWVLTNYPLKKREGGDYWCIAHRSDVCCSTRASSSSCSSSSSPEQWFTGSSCFTECSSSSQCRAGWSDTEPRAASCCSEQACHFTTSYPSPSPRHESWGQKGPSAEQHEDTEGRTGARGLCSFQVSFSLVFIYCRRKWKSEKRRLLQWNCACLPMHFKGCVERWGQGVDLQHALAWLAYTQRKKQIN